MSGVVIHFLTETDSFSDLHGAALQRWVANVLRYESEMSMVACSRADASWGLPQVKTIPLLGLRAYSKLKGRYRLPWSVRQPLLRRVLRPALEGLPPDSVMWVHNRPDYAAAIQEDVRAIGAKLVLHLHNSLLVSFPRKITGCLCADRLVFCSRYLEREARSAFPELENTTVLHNGADESRFYPKRQVTDTGERRMPVVLFAGRLVPEKGAHIFVEAMWLLQARGIRARGRVLGATGFGSANPSTAYSRSLLRNAPPNLEFGGYKPAAALAEEFRKADIFCSPSVWEEPFGLVNVEAMASGLAVVATRGGGVPEVFAEGGGLLVERGSTTALATALERLIRDSDLRCGMAFEGYRSFRRNFTWKTVHRRYREVLAGLGHRDAAGDSAVDWNRTDTPEELCQDEEEECPLFP